MLKVYGREWKVALISILAFLLILPYAFAGGDRNLSDWVDEVSEDFETIYPVDWQTYAETGHYTWGRSNFDPYEGTWSMWCAAKNLHGQPTKFPSGGYANSMSAWTVIGPVNLQFCTEATLSFYMKYLISDNDAVGVYAHTGDNNWQGVNFTGNSDGYQYYEYNLAQWPNLGNLLGLKQVYFAFSFYSDGGGAATGAFVDNVEIKKFFTGWPDLVVEGINFQKVPHVQGERVNMTIPVANHGENPSPTTSVQLFISEDNSIDLDSDLLLGSFDVPVPLEAGSSYTISVQTNTPVVLPPAGYYVGAVVDHSNSIQEGDEDNNETLTETDNFTIAPFSGWDVVVNEGFGYEFPSGPWSRTPGNGNYSWGWNRDKVFEGKYSIWCTGSNFNGAPNTWPESGYADNADSWVKYESFDLVDCQKADLSFVFSQKLHSDADRLKVLISVGGGWMGHEFKLNSGGWLYQQLDLMAWPGLGSLKGFSNIRIAFNFTSNGVGNAEGTFVDKVIVRRQFIMPDLTCSSLAATPATLAPGDELAIASSVKNIGEDVSEASKVDLYLSTDDVITAADDLLATNAVDALEMDQEVAFNNTATLDAGLADGTYYIGALVDGDNAVDETDENNNVTVQQINVVSPKPDLTCQVLMAQATSAKVLETKVKVTNNGEAASTATQMDYILKNGTESVIGTIDIDALDAGASKDYTKTLDLTDALTTGDYSLEADVDPDNNVPESNEENNDSSLDFSYVETGIDAQVTPADFTLQQNYPNPFNPQTSIRYALPQEADVMLTISNVYGQVIRVLVSNRMEAGNHEVIWDGTNQYGEKVASGVYFYQISAGSFKELRKMIFIQ